MSPKEKQAAAQQTFVFHKPLTNESPAKAGSRARMRGEPEYNIFVFKKFLDLQVKNIDNLIFFR